MADKARSDGRPARALDDMPTLRRLVVILAVLSAALLAADFLVHRHSELAIENLFGVYVALGLIGVGLIAGAGYLVRRGLARREDYYDR